MNNNNEYKDFIEEIGLPNPEDINTFEKSSVKTNQRKNTMYNLNGDKVPDWVQVSENGKVTINTGLLADYLIDSIPAIYVANQFYIYENGVYRKSLENEDLTIVKELIDSKYSTMYRIKDAAAQWKTDRKVKMFPDKINNNTYIINLKNCLYDLRDNRCYNHTPKYKTTIQLNANYNPNAKGETFERFIKEAIPNELNRKIAQEILGYCLTSFTEAKKLFILLGKKDTGKSTFLRIIENLIPEENVSHVELQAINKDYNTAQLFNKLVNIFADLPDRGIKDVGLIKALTGEDTISARHIYGTPFDFINKAKMIFSTNNMPPNYGDKSDAFYERLVILPFNQQKMDGEKDPLLKYKLAEENDYIFMWALEGLKRLIKQNFIFTYSPEVRALINEYKTSSNNVLQFVDEKCIINENMWVYRSLLYKEYREFCQENGLLPLNSTKFNKELETNLNLKRKQMGPKRLRAFVGLGLINSDRGE